MTQSKIEQQLEDNFGDLHEYMRNILTDNLLK